MKKLQFGASRALNGCVPLNSLFYDLVVFRFVGVYFAFSYFRELFPHNLIRRESAFLKSHSLVCAYISYVKCLFGKVKYFFPPRMKRMKQNITKFNSIFSFTKTNVYTKLHTLHSLAVMLKCHLIQRRTLASECILFSNQMFASMRIIVKLISMHRSYSPVLISHSISHKFFQVHRKPIHHNNKQFLLHFPCVHTSIR